jgi:hypothetical protein
MHANASLPQSIRPYSLNVFGIVLFCEHPGIYYPPPFFHKVCDIRLLHALPTCCHLPLCAIVDTRSPRVHSTPGHASLPDHFLPLVYPLEHLHYLKHYKPVSLVCERSAKTRCPVYRIGLTISRLRRYSRPNSVWSVFVGGFRNECDRTTSYVLCSTTILIDHTDTFIGHIYHYHRLPHAAEIL